MNDMLELSTLHTAGSVLAVLVAAWVALRVVERGVDRMRLYMERRISNLEDVQRIGTLGRVLRHLGTVVIVVVAIMLILHQLGISIAPILATAGVAGIAVGFGAQSLVKDYFTGLFLLLEDQIRQGDVVAIAGKDGLVEEVTLRYVRLRDFEGHVHFVPNGEIKIVTNLTRGYAQALIEVAIGFREDTDAALALMREVGQEMRGDPQWAPRLLDEVEIVGVERWAEGTVILRCRVRVQPLEQWNVKREFLRRLQKAFRARGIEVHPAQLALIRGGAPRTIPGLRDPKRA